METLLVIYCLKMSNMGSNLVESGDGDKLIGVVGWGGRLYY